MVEITMPSVENCNSFGLFFVGHQNIALMSTKICSDAIDTNPIIPCPEWPNHLDKSFHRFDSKVDWSTGPFTTVLSPCSLERFNFVFYRCLIQDNLYATLQCGAEPLFDRFFLFCGFFIRGPNSSFCKNDNLCFYTSQNHFFRFKIDLQNPKRPANHHWNLYATENLTATIPICWTLCSCSNL